MKRSKKVFSITIVLLVMLFVLATPALADPRQLVGERINVNLGDPTEYPADTPFFVIHGSGTDAPGATPIAAGHMGFALEVDGEYVEADWDYRSGNSAREGGPNIVWSGSAFNFPDGLPAGEHTFIGHWYVRCLHTESPCENPMDPVDFEVHPLTVNFYEP